MLMGFFLFFSVTLRKFSNLNFGPYLNNTIFFVMFLKHILFLLVQTTFVIFFPVLTVTENVTLKSNMVMATRVHVYL